MGKYERDIERYLPMAVAFASFFIVLFLGFDINSVCGFKDLLRSIITISAILIGFLATMMSILIASSTKKVVENIRKNHATKLLKSYFVQTLTSGFVVAVLSTLLNMADGMKGDISRMILACWVGIVSFFLLCAARIMWVMVGVLHGVISENIGEDKDSANCIEPDVSMIDFKNIGKNKSER